MAKQTDLFHPFDPQPAAGEALPERFTFPFHYVPHPLAVRATVALQEHLRAQDDWNYDFGLGAEHGIGGRGKMFGVLVVERADGVLGFLAAYSGKLANSNHLPGFVPPVYDLLDAAGFYKAGEREINTLNATLATLEQDPAYAAARHLLATETERSRAEIMAEKQARKAAKRNRDDRRNHARKNLEEKELVALETELGKESVGRHFALKDLTRAWTRRLERLEAEVAAYTDRITALRQQRKKMSYDLQQRIFQQYRFLDANGRERDLTDIFRDTIFRVPPAGAGECAAPKLLQYAYTRHLRPVALAEFWWGQSPRSEIRKHGRFYPACRGKCEPILGHMLGGLDVDPNPLLENPARGKQLEVVFEDDNILVVNKPAEFLSVPGKHIQDSVWLRIKQRYPEATGPLIVHRLDMSTSGLLLLAKNKETHKFLQGQFLKRSVKKRYVALLDGQVSDKAGTIDLPLRGDPTDRPRQIVCDEHGKTARTHWRVVGREGNRTRVHLWPVTGRTHQLRVHTAHPLGLDASIVGDDLYGLPGARLCLHAERITFVLPGSGKEMTVTAAATF